MDITALAAWGEFLGGIAVVISLIYLASQIRQNSRLLRTSTASATSDISGRLSTLLVQDPEVARIFCKQDPQRLNPAVGGVFAVGVEQLQLRHDAVSVRRLPVALVFLVLAVMVWREPRL